MFEPLSNVFARVAASRQVAGTFSAAEACAAAEKVIASELPALAGQAKGKFVKADTIWLAAANSAAAAELHAIRDSVLQQLSKRFPRIQKIRIVVEPRLFWADLGSD